jgi:hypothetical protein
MSILFYNICEGKHWWNIKCIVFYVVAHGAMVKILEVPGFALNVLRIGLMLVKSQNNLENAMVNMVNMTM